jgi:hypothetical protein
MAAMNSILVISSREAIKLLAGVESNTVATVSLLPALLSGA